MDCLDTHPADLLRIGYQCSDLFICFASSLIFGVCSNASSILRGATTVPSTILGVSPRCVSICPVGVSGASGPSTRSCVLSLRQSNPDSQKLHTLRAVSIHNVSVCPICLLTFPKVQLQISAFDPWPINF